ncbi:hypothetical protein ALC60_05670 [Trachymyrmex zeteki]|uniref:DUF4218 domain-containing protein n=1 Tax=Mycetomoellerius zeteki TaxID=64791 RepID=A0A151X4U4_9HYME|nr:hypothetical protein ALC60_05670 [Trachymyrmex zeteki]
MYILGFVLLCVREKYFEKYNYRFKNICTINVGINIDGLPMSRSSTSSLWPILGCVLPYKEVFIIGAYYGSKKPNNCNDFLKNFVEEIIKLINNGVFLCQKSYNIKIKQIVCDAPAKSFILNVKGHNINAAKRTNDSFRNETDENFHLGCTILKNIPELHFIENIPLDYMHLLCLGVIRKCFNLWIKGDLKVRLQHYKCQVLSNKLETVIKQAIPVEFCRKPRSLDYLKQWKATEYRQILLYTGPIVLQDILPNDLYYHFLTLYVAARILCCEDLCKKYLDYAEELLKHYVKSFKILYGEHHVSHNIHGLIHICNDVRIHDTLDSFSAFRYENFLQEVKKLIRKADKPLQQLHRRYVEKNIVAYSAVSYKKDPKIKVLKEHFNGPIIHNCTSPQYKFITTSGYVIKINDNVNNCCLMSDRSILKIENIAYCNTRKCLVAIGRKYLIKNDLFDVPCPSSLIDIYVVSDISELFIYEISDIVNKMLIIPYTNNTSVVIPLLHIE